MLTHSDALILAQAEINKEGKDYIYKQKEREEGSRVFCYYYEGGKPSCLVGRILENAGLIDASVEMSNDQNELEVDGLVKSLRISVEPKAIRFLSELQYHQDSGKTWGTALELALR